MVIACKLYLSGSTLNGEDDLLWNKVDREVHKHDASSTNSTLQHLDIAQKAQIQAQLDARLKVHKANKHIIKHILKSM